MKAPPLAALALVTFLSVSQFGCVKTTSSRVPGVSYEALDSKALVFIYANEVPSGMDDVLPASEAPSGVQLGSVAVNAAEAASWNKVISQAKKEARTLGGDVLVVERWGYVPVTSYSHSGGISIPITTSAKGFNATVIRAGH